jgi:endonuclease/exonuclease/phosphatase family metal-dependent hydrolase
LIGYQFCRKKARIGVKDKYKSKSCTFLKAALLVVLGVFSLSIYAGESVCATWNMEWFPSGVPNRRIPEKEPERILEAGRIIGKVAPDLLFVQEVRDAESCEKLANASGSNGLKVAVCSGFKDQAGITVFQQCAILTTYPVVESAAERWHSYGIVDPPRGYAYALLDIEGELVACYCVHLKSNLVRKETDRQMNILKRELAASQLLAHVKKIGIRNGKKVSKFIIAGDFNTTLDDPLYISESTIRSLLDAGFKSGFEGVEPKDRVTLPAKGPYKDVTFDYIFHSGFGRTNNARVMPPSEVTDHRMVVMTFKP